jgi:hypothetical protein
VGVQSNDALTALTAAYEDGKTLDEILSMGAGKTGTDVDDAVAQTIRDSIGQARNTLYNIHGLVLGLADTLEDIYFSLDDLGNKPLKDVVEGDESVTEKE